METNVDSEHRGGQTEVDAFTSRWFGRLSAPSTPIVKMHTPDERYSMENGRRGRAIIFNHETFHWRVAMNARVGTQADAECLSERFQELGFEVCVHQDATVEKVNDVIFEASRADHSDCDAFVCVFLSHGAESAVYAHDGIIILQDLIDNFRADTCPTLAGKPKLFFIEASQGGRYETAVDAADSADVMDEVEPMTDVDAARREKHTIPAGADFLVAYSTTQGYCSHLEKGHGSWFVQALSHVLAKHGADFEINEIMAVVTRIVSERKVEGDLATDPEMVDTKQCPCYISMLTKKVYFHKT